MTMRAKVFDKILNGLQKKKWKVKLISVCACLWKRRRRRRRRRRIAIDELANDLGGAPGAGVWLQLSWKKLVGEQKARQKEIEHLSKQKRKQRRREEKKNGKRRGWVGGRGGGGGLGGKGCGPIDGRPSRIMAKRMDTGGRKGQWENTTQQKQEAEKKDEKKE